MTTAEQYLDLTPAERAVLRQIRDLFREASVRAYRVPSLISRWPPNHRETYRVGYEGLINKGLLVQSRDQGIFQITGAGLRVNV